LLVAVAGEDRALVAVDVLDAREGDEVLVAVGSGARNVLAPGPANRHILCDAAISLIVDGEEA
jgi:microcompartment protein CcmK/EutM